ncbi:MAG: hypothetical protein NWF06_01835, partial [Candidatus Bathyarchaeota archaeon]|nr:hypothetical protein [Candidatus Bathyarchaeum sp.]
GNLFVESWLQINLFGKCYCFSKRKMMISHPLNIGIKLEPFTIETKAHIHEVAKKLNELSDKKRGIGI